MVHERELVDISYRPPERILPPKEKRLIDAWMMAHPRECAGYGRPAVNLHGARIEACVGTTTRNRPLCYGCLKVYGIAGEWDNWLTFKVRDIAKEHRANAIADLFRQDKFSQMDDDGRLPYPLTAHLDDAENEAA